MARPWRWLREAWDLIGEDLPIFSVAAFLTISLSFLTAFIIALPLYAGLCIMLLEKLQGNKPTLGHLWEGLTSRFPAAISIWVVYMVVALPFDVVNFYLHGLPAPWPTLGIASVIIGLTVVSTPIFFCLPLIADRDLSAQDALRLSWSRVWPQWRVVLGAVSVCILMAMFGVFACGLGIIIVLPLIAAIQVLACREIVGDADVPRLIPIKEPTQSEGGADEQK